MNYKDLIYKLSHSHTLSDEELIYLLESDDDNINLLLACYADETRKRIYGSDVYIRGLIEFSNYCKNNCYYCGIRCNNEKLIRYRLSKDEILECCNEGYTLGFRTFVLQSGEDLTYTDDILCDIISEIKNNHPDCSITLSVGEKDYNSYKRYFDAGTDRYLLRHETADNLHYSKLHPDAMSLRHRKECLYMLKDIGFQVGAGFMVGSPFQTTDNLITDLRFLQELKPDMVGIGPFIPHNDTPFKEYNAGSLRLTLKLISITRLMLPYALIPSTTALGTIHPQGRELGLKAGANVVMPNLSPLSVRKLYQLYDNKICTGDEAAQYINNLSARVNKAGYNIVTDKGDVKKEYKHECQ